VAPSGYTRPVTPSADSLLPDLQHALAGRYVLERRLGRGGMGVVYLARELRLDRRVAIKLLPPERSVQPAARERFLREARTAAQLSHPGIVPIFAVHEVRDFVFFVMAYVEGETLGQRVRADGPLSHGAAAQLLEEVGRALAHAHARGVVHRDVKPDNILLDQVTGRALVSDFGIAHLGSGAVSAPRQAVGTAEFMSPEQVIGGPVDGRSDLYSLGVVGFFALTGHLPFDGPDAMTVLARHVTDPPPTIASVAPEVPLRLAEAVERCLAKDPDARYPSADAFAEAVGAALDRRAAVAVRAFVTGARHLSTSALLYGAAAGVGLPLLAVRFLELTEPRAKAATVAAAVAIALVPLAVMLARVRRLLSAGYGRQHLTDALSGARPSARGARVPLRVRTVAARAGAAPAGVSVRSGRRGDRRRAAAGAGPGGGGGRSSVVLGRRDHGAARRRDCPGAHGAPHRPQGGTAAAVLERAAGPMALQRGRAAARAPAGAGAGAGAE